MQSAIALGITPLAIDEDDAPRLLRTATSVALPAATPATSATLHVAHVAQAWGVRSAAVPQLDPVALEALLGHARLDAGLVEIGLQRHQAAGCA